MRPVLRRLIAVAAAVVPTVAATLFFIPPPAAQAAPTTTTWLEKDFGTVCSSPTGVVQLRVVYRVMTDWAGSAADVDQIWVRSYDTQGAPLVVQDREWGERYRNAEDDGPYENRDYLTPAGGIPAAGEWTKLSQPWRHYLGAESRMLMSVSRSLTFWLNNNIADCTVDITRGYESPTGWTKHCSKGISLNYIEENKLVVSAVSNAGKNGRRLFTPEQALLVVREPCRIYEATWQNAGLVQVGGYAKGARTYKVVQNRWNLPLFKEWPNGPFVAHAFLEKHYHVDGREVTNSNGGDLGPGDDKLEGSTTEYALLLGGRYLGALGGSELTTYLEWNGNGRGAHRSSATANFAWGVPVVNPIINLDTAENVQLSITAYADGRAVCGGGTNCVAIPPS